MEGEKELKEKHIELRRGISHCRSLVHHWWFRVMLVMTAIDMIVLGFIYAIGFNPFDFLPHIPLWLRIVFGFLYIVTALFVIHYVFEYEREKEFHHYVCFRCFPDFDSIEEEGGETSERDENE